MPLHKQREPIGLFLVAYWHDKRWKGFEGATVKILDLAYNLDRLGLKVTLFLPRGKYATEDVRFTLIEVPFVDIPFFRSISFSLFLLYLMARRCASGVPAAIYMRRMNSLLPAWFAKRKGCLFFLEVNDDPFRRNFQEGSKIVFQLRAFLDCKIDESNLKTCDRAFVITEQLSREILQRVPAISPEKLIIAPSGANLSLFRPVSRDRSRRSLQLDPQKKYVGFVGTLLKHQGIDILIQASHEILIHEPRCRFIIIGEGPLKEQWMKQVLQESLDDQYRFLGQIEYRRVPEWINSMDICVAPYAQNAGLRSPVKVFDYMACAKPVVASRIDGTTTQFEGTDTASLVEPGNPSELAAAIIRLLGDQTRAQEMGVNARRHVEALFDRKFNAKQVAEVLYAIRQQAAARD